MDITLERILSLFDGLFSRLWYPRSFGIVSRCGGLISIRPGNCQGSVLCVWLGMYYHLL